MKTRSLFALPILLLTACVGPSPERLTASEDYLVVVNSVRLPDYMEWYTRFAEHAWIDVKQGDEASWTRIEIGGPSSGVEVFKIDSKDARATHRWDNRVSVLETAAGRAARQAIPQLLQLAEAELDFGHSETTYNEDGSWSVLLHVARGRPYEAYPGPNSNTFIAALVEATPELHSELHHNSVGKDYPRGFRAGITSSGYGFEADSSWLGAGIGLRQGVEVHLAQLTLGVSLWPPAVKLPFLPRIGIHQGWLGAMGTLDRD